MNIAETVALSRFGSGDVGSSLKNDFDLQHVVVDLLGCFNAVQILHVFLKIYYFL